MIVRDERDDLVESERRRHHRPAFAEFQCVRKSRRHAAGGNVGVGVGDEDGDVVANQLADQAAFRMIVRHRGDAAQQHRMVGDDQLRARFGRFSHDRGCHVDRE
jgi:hypothetical protein